MREHGACACCVLKPSVRAVACVARIIGNIIESSFRSYSVQRAGLVIIARGEGGGHTAPPHAACTHMRAV